MSRMNEKTAGYFQNEVANFFEADVDLIDVRLEGLSMQVDWYLRFDLDGKRALIAVDKNGRFEGMVSDLVKDDESSACLYTNKVMCQSTNSKTVIRTAVRHLVVTAISAAL